jgi:hypothetical protein
MSRVLSDSGIAAFSEPGPDHSKDPVSQAELKNGVLENDIVMEDIWGWADAAGFRRLELTAFPIDRVTFSLENYKRFIAGDADYDRMVVNPIRSHAAATRTFFLYKEATRILWSTTGRGLAAKLDVKLRTRRFHSGGTIEGEVSIFNNGEATWLPSGEGPGAVNLGFHLKNIQTGEYRLDYGRAAISRSGRTILPGDEVHVRVNIPTPSPGGYELVFDLVSEHVTWFGERTLSSSTVFRIEVF